MKCYKELPNNDEAVAAVDELITIARLTKTDASKIIAMNNGHFISLKANGEPSAVFERIIETGYSYDEAIKIRKSFFSDRIIEATKSNGVYWFDKANGAFEIIPPAFDEVSVTKGGIEGRVLSNKIINTIVGLDNNNDIAIDISFKSNELYNINPNFTNTGELKDSISLIKVILLDIFDYIKHQRMLEYMENSQYISDFDLYMKKLSYTNTAAIKSELLKELQQIEQKHNEVGNTNQAMFIKRISYDILNNNDINSLFNKTLDTLNIKTDLLSDTGNEDGEVIFTKRLYADNKFDYDMSDDIDIEVVNALSVIPALKITDDNEDGVHLYSKHTGIYSYSQYSDIKNVLKSRLSNSHDIDHMERKLSTLASNNPVYRNLYNKFVSSRKNNDGFAVKLFKGFHGHMRVVATNSIKTNIKGLSNTLYLLTSDKVNETNKELISNIKRSIESNIITKDFYENVRLNLELLAKDNSLLFKNSDERTQLINDLKEIGINISTKALSYMLSYSFKNTKHGIFSINKLFNNLYQIQSAYNNKQKSNANLSAKDKNNIKRNDILDGITIDNRESKSILYGSLISYSKAISEFKDDGTDQTFIGVENESEQSINPHNELFNLLDFIESIKDENDIKFINWLDNIIQDGTLAYNYIIKYDIAGATSAQLLSSAKRKVILDSLRELNIIQYAGYRSNNKGVKYSISNNNNYVLSIANFYLNKMVSLDDINKDTVRLPMVVLSDSSQMYFVRQNRVGSYINGELTIDFNTNKFKILSVDNNGEITSILKSLLNIIASDVVEMEKAKELIFTTDNEGKLIVKKDINVTSLTEGYHYTLDEAGNPEFLDKATGFPTGRVFKLNTIKSLNLMDDNGNVVNDNKILFDKNGLFRYSSELLGNMTISRYNTIVKDEELLPVFKRMVSVLNDHINDDIKYTSNKFDIQRDNIIKIIKSNKSYAHIIKNKFGATNNYDFSKLTPEDLIAYGFISSNTIITDANRNHIMDNFYYNLFIADFTINHMVNVHNQFTNFIGSLAYFKNTEDTNKRAKKFVSPALIYDIDDSKYKDVTFAVLKDVILTEDIIKILENDKTLTEEQRKDIANSYKGITASDGQGFITEHGMALYLLAKGEKENVNRLFNKVNDKYQLKDDINPNDRLDLLRPIKPFISYRHFNKEQQKLQPLTIKNSLMLLTRRMAKGNSNYERLLEIADKQNIEHFVFESTFKVGAYNVNDIFNDKGNIIDGTENLATITIPRHEFRDQMAVPNHHKDTTIKAGIQIFKLIFNNMRANTTYTINGKKYKADEMFTHIQNVISSMILDKSSSVKSYFTFDDEGNVTDESIAKILLEKAGNLLTDNEKLLLTLDKNGKLIKPLDFRNTERWQKLLSSVFTNNITNLKLNGMHNVMLSSLMFDKTNFISDKGSEHNLTITKDNKGRYVFEAMVSRWSKDFYDKRTGEPIPIEQLSDELKTMIAYRIPTSAKHSAVVIKVVGFLDDNQGSSIMLPHAVIARTGADFDIDTLYININNHIEISKNKYDVIPFNDYKLNDYNKDTLAHKSNNIIKVKAFSSYLKLNNNSHILSNYYKILNDRLNYDEVNTILNSYKAHINALNIDNEDKTNIIKLLTKLAKAHQTYNIIIQRSENVDNRIAAIRMSLTTQDITTVQKDLELLEKLVKEQTKLNVNKLSYNNISNTIYYKLDDIIRKYKDDASIDKTITDSITNLKQELNEIELKSFNKRKAEAFEYIKPYIEEFTNDTIYNKNDYKAKSNEVLQGMISILSNNDHIGESYSTAHFKDSSAVVEAYKPFSTNTNMNNPISFSTQFDLKEKSLVPKQNLNIVANTNAINGIHQRIKSVLVSSDNTDDLYVKTPYDTKELKKVHNVTTNDELRRVLENKYLEGYVEVTDKVTYIKYKTLGFTYDENNPYLNIYNKPLLEDYAQQVDHMPDAVKENITENETPFLINAANTYGKFGDTSYALYMIGQEVGMLLNKYNDITTADIGINQSSAYTKAAYELINKIDTIYRINNYIHDLYTTNNYTDVLKLLYKFKEARDTNLSIDERNNIMKDIENDPKYYIALDVTSNFVKLDKHTTLDQVIKYFEDNKDYIGDNIFNSYVTKTKTGERKLNTFDIYNDLKTNISLYTKQELINIKKLGSKIANDDESITNTDKIDYYIKQLNILMKLEEVSKLGKQIGNYDMLLRFDKIGIGDINENIENINNLINFSPNINIETHINGNPYNIIDAIFPNIRGINNNKSDEDKIDSVYSSMEAYAQYSNILFKDMFKDTFKLSLSNETYASLYNTIYDNFSNKYTKDFRNNIRRAINKYIIAKTIILNPNSELYTNDDEIKRILGFGKIEANKRRSNITLNNFSKLSFPEMIEVMKYKLGNSIDQYNILNYINAEIDTVSNIKNGYHTIRVKDILTDTKLVKLVQESMFNMKNTKFGKIFIDNLIKYSLLTKGYSIGGNSINHFISINLLDNYNINTPLNDLDHVLNSTKADEILPLLKQFSDKYIIETSPIDNGIDIINVPSGDLNIIFNNLINNGTYTENNVQFIKSNNNPIHNLRALMLGDKIVSITNPISNKTIYAKVTHNILDNTSTLTLLNLGKTDVLFEPSDTTVLDRIEILNDNNIIDSVPTVNILSSIYNNEINC